MVKIAVKMQDRSVRIVEAKGTLEGFDIVRYFTGEMPISAWYAEYTNYAMPSMLKKVTAALSQNN